MWWTCRLLQWQRDDNATCLHWGICSDCAPNTIVFLAAKTAPKKPIEDSSEGSLSTDRSAIPQRDSLRTPCAQCCGVAQVFTTDKNLDISEPYSQRTWNESRACWILTTNDRAAPPAHGRRAGSSDKTTDWATLREELRELRKVKHLCTRDTAPACAASLS